MSEMEFFYGEVVKADQDIVPEDTDEFYDFEEEQGCIFVNVKGTVYAVKKIEDLDSYGFSTVINPPKTDSTFCVLCYWYNGGASVHEVVSSAIETYLKRD